MMEPVVLETFRSPEDTRTWKLTRRANADAFVLPDGRVFTGVERGEPPEAVVVFTKIRGLAPAGLVRADRAMTIKKAETRERRKQRAINRGERARARRRTPANTEAIE